MSRALYYIAFVLSLIGCCYFVFHTGVYLIGRGGPPGGTDLFYLINPALLAVACLLFRRQYSREPSNGSTGFDRPGVLHVIGAICMVVGAVWMTGQVRIAYQAVQSLNSFDATVADLILPPLVLLLFGAYFYFSTRGALVGGSHSVDRK